MTCIVFAVLFFAASLAHATATSAPSASCDASVFLSHLDGDTVLQQPSISLEKTGRIIEGRNLIWGENIGWINLRTTHADFKIGSNILVGWVWLENCGWVCLGEGHPLDGMRYTNRSGFDWGINNDGEGNLSGFAWSEVTGWINFQTSHSRVYLGKAGQFYGYAWGENVGWMHFGPGENVQYLAKADLGPWKEIGQESRDKLARGPNDSEISCDSVPLSGLKTNHERDNKDSDSFSSLILGRDDSCAHIRCCDTPAYISSLAKLFPIRAPPL
ncbi:MAG: hypothetical protein NTZ78_13800 [Candidatus Aureabacteria bacterium]|nr:hypothetical protein [Candidatus Auribacterota bacterium]